MKNCYFCHLPVSYPWVVLTLPEIAKIKGGITYSTEYAHVECCELARLDTPRSVLALHHPGFTFKP